MQLPELRLLAIAGPPLLAPEGLLDACRAAEAGGVTAIQVRLKTAPASTILRLTEVLVEHLTVPVYVNDRADVAWVARARGVHLGAEDLSPVAVRTFAAPPFRIGVSVGTPAEAEQASRAPVDYWSVGSVYATGTKPDAGPPIGVRGFRTLAARAPRDLPVVAIGGIGPANAERVLSAGAAGVAVSRAVFGAADVEGAARALRAIVDRVHRH